MSSYAEFKKELLEDSKVKAAYDELQPEYDIIQTMIDARKSQHMTYKNLLALVILLIAGAVSLFLSRGRA